MNNNGVSGQLCLHVFWKQVM